MHESITLSPRRRSAWPAAGSSGDESHRIGIEPVRQRLSRHCCWPMGNKEVANRVLQSRNGSEGLAQGREHHEVTALFANSARPRSGFSSVQHARRLACCASRPRCVLRKRAQTVDHTHLIALRSCLIEIRHHACHSLTHLVGQVQEVIKRPVQVVGQKPDLLPEAIGPDRRYSPSAPPPPTSTMTVSPQCGQMTSAIVVPSVLIRR